MRFSQRAGFKPIRDQIQLKSIDERLENKLWNAVYDGFLHWSMDGSFKDRCAAILWKDFLGKRSDEIPISHFGIDSEEIVAIIKRWYFESEWYEKLDLIEFLSELEGKFERHIGFTPLCNLCLESEVSAYRIINGQVAPVTTEEEVSAIEDAINSSTKWGSVNTHLSTAIEFLSSRDNPDYRNCIKEAISAVEALCKIISGNKKVSFGQALATIEKNFQLHGALKTAFTALYGYTSDTGGIRHSLLEDDLKITFEDAKFMLVSCSAFINYLKIKAEIKH
tara:strand:- start:18046 stop:18882 length:837 start_codon:yes stop_codon:yes gene_type:complete